MPIHADIASYYFKCAPHKYRSPGLHYAGVVGRYRWTFGSPVIKFGEWTRFIATDLLLLINARAMTMISNEGSVAVNFQTEYMWNGIQKILINLGKPRICGVPVHAPGDILKLDNYSFEVMIKTR